MTVMASTPTKYPVLTSTMTYLCSSSMILMSLVVVVPAQVLRFCRRGKRALCDFQHFSTIFRAQFRADAVLHIRHSDPGSVFYGEERSVIRLQLLGHLIHAT